MSPNTLAPNKTVHLFSKLFNIKNDKTKAILIHIYIEYKETNNKYEYERYRYRKRNVSDRNRSLHYKQTKRSSRTFAILIVLQYKIARQSRGQSVVTIQSALCLFKKNVKRVAFFISRFGNPSVAICQLAALS